MKNISVSILLFFFVFFFVGCGGGSGGSTGPQSVNGYIIDSPIKGIAYICEDKIKYTDSLGKFTCTEGKTVYFGIGNVYLGSYHIPFPSSNPFYLTPAMLYGLNNQNLSDQRILNFIQFIQSLDSDANPLNGIDINESISYELEDYYLDISNPNLTTDDINETLYSLGVSIIPQNTALENYKESLKDTLHIVFDPEPYLYQQWYLKENSDFYYEQNINKDAHIHPGDYLNKYTGKGVKIAIIDNGLDVNHEDLQGAIIKTYDITTKTSDVSPESDNETNFHGTAITGIIGARVNAKGIQGIASNSQIIFIKYTNYISDDEIIEMFNKAEEFGADIINCSWGTGDVSDVVRDRIVDLANNGRDGKGTIIIFSSGNDGEDMQNDEANIPEVISVGSSNIKNDRASYSNYGTNLDILAPGGEYIGMTTLDISGSEGGGYHNENYLLYNDYFIGTSASAPVVTGIIALLLEKNPNLTRVQIENMLHSTADKIGNMDYINGRNDYYGYGKINLSKLLEY